MSRVDPSRQCQRIPFAVLATVLVGCADSAAKSSGTRGELGRVEFSYQRSCFFGCPLEQPLLESTRERIGLSAAGDVEGISVKSDAPDVADFAVERSCYCERSDSTSRLELRNDAACPGVWRKHCDNAVLVEAGTSGAAKLELRDARDAVIDRVRVIVHVAHDAHFTATLPNQLGPTPGTRFELATGQALGLALTLYDEAGLELLAPEGIAWHVDDVGVATISGFLTGAGADVHAGLSVNVQATGAGDTEVHIAVPGLDTSVDLHVAP